MERTGITAPILTDLMDEDDLRERVAHEMQAAAEACFMAGTAIMSGQPGFTRLITEAMAARVRADFYLTELKAREG